MGNDGETKPQEDVPHPRHASFEPEGELIHQQGSTRMCAFRNVVIQSLYAADLEFVRTLDIELRRRMRRYPNNVISFALLRTGLTPAPSDVRKAMSGLIAKHANSVRHFVIVEDTGLMGQLLIPVIRAVIVFTGRHVRYSIHSAREHGITCVLPHIIDAGDPRRTELKFRDAVELCASTRTKPAAPIP